MTLLEVAKHALEAMEDAMYRADTHEFYDAKESLRYAIEQAEQAEQEPVASLMTNIQSGDQKVVWNDDGFDRALWHETPLYTAPILRKPWVGLTVEEIFDCTHHITRIQQDEWVATDDDLCEFADTAAQVLKKKNGYGTSNKPLSKEQIDNICKSFRLGYTDEDLVRAIERAHGIGEQHGS